MTDLKDSSIFGGPFEDVRVEPWEADRVANLVDRAGLWDTDVPDMRGVR